MAQRILVFEKNTDFIRELEIGFGRHGAKVEAVHDADASLASAKSDLPAMVLLSVDAMSAPGEAFLVCKKFKSDDALANVPFVIMGGPHHAESFESHKKLKKRRADEYLQLPMGFDELLERVRVLVPFAASAQADAGGPQLDLGSDDEDISAFADSAFDDLVFEEPSLRPEAEKSKVEPVHASLPPPIPSPALRLDLPPAARPPSPVVGAGTGAGVGAAVDENVRHRGSADPLSPRSKALEGRIGTIDDRPRGVDPSRLTAAPSTTSSRDYLELREQLNRKDKELLALRDEVTARDRQLLDGSDRALELERAQAELGDSLDQAMRQLQEAQDRLREHEVDKDAVAQRAEDLKARLQRSEDRAKKSEGELDALKKAHVNELAGLKAAHGVKLEQIENTVSAEVARMRASYAATAEEASAKHAAALKSADAASQATLSNALAAHANELSAREAAHERALADAQSTHEAALLAAREAGESEKAHALQELAAAHQAELAAQVAEKEQASVAALHALTNELEAKHKTVAKGLEDKHGREVAGLARKLMDSETKQTMLGQKVEELEQAKHDLEALLNTRVSSLTDALNACREERDLARNELSSARAGIESLERNQVAQSERISRLEGQLAAVEGRWTRANAKLDADAELLTRVRRALGIGLGLLDQQQEVRLEE